MQGLGRHQRIPLHNLRRHSNQLLLNEALDLMEGKAYIIQSVDGSRVLRDVVYFGKVLRRLQQRSLKDHGITLDVL